MGSLIAADLRKKFKSCPKYIENIYARRGAWGLFILRYITYINILSYEYRVPTYMYTYVYNTI